MQKILLAGLILIPLCALPLSAQYSVYDFDPVVVTGSSVPTALSATIRPLSVVNRATIAASGADNVEQLLESAAGIDVRTRGPAGIQSDISIRGVGCEQTLILIDGIKITDPQTGHHNLDLPVSLEDIEQIEILKGGGSKLYGPNAFGGVINIITRKAQQSEMELKVRGGDYGSYGASASVEYPLGKSSNRCSIRMEHSDGYRHNTDFDRLNLFLKNRLHTATAKYTFNCGYTGKDFGANGFYSRAYPNQREATGTLFAGARAIYPIKRNRISGSINWRRHSDHYILDYENPAFYENRHTTNVYQAATQITLDRKHFTHSIGCEIGQDQIVSNSLGDHRRRRYGLSYEGRSTSRGKFAFQLGASAYYYSNRGWDLCPGIDFRYRLTEHTAWKTSLNRSFRVPTFTELYYNSPANLGNPNLASEKSWTVETVIVRQSAGLQFSSGLYYLKGTDLIDWVRYDKDQAWQALNIATLKSFGFETAATYIPHSSRYSAILKSVSLAYNYNYKDRSSALYESKYLLNSLRQQLVLSLAPPDLFGIEQYWTIRYEDRLNQGNYWITDIHLSKCIKDLTISLTLDNLLNVNYTDFIGIPMPGRWLRGSIAYKIE